MPDNPQPQLHRQNALDLSQAGESLRDHYVALLTDMIQSLEHHRLLSNRPDYSQVSRGQSVRGLVEEVYERLEQIEDFGSRYIPGYDVYLSEDTFLFQ